ncbi:MAG: AAA family ATPase [Lachnospiraceae bacterium]|nr:AAA family ATPase [Lachnospiraceae bacterium]
MMSNLISSIDIKSFRGINSFRLENLSQINILTGDNNCGKTSILEILESFGQPDDFRMWSSLIRKDFRESSLRGLTYYEGIYDLFDINSEKKRLEYTIVMDGISTNVALLAKEIEEEITEKEFYDLQGIYFPQENKDEGLLDNTQLVSKLEIEIKINGQTVSREKIYEGQRRLGLRSRSGKEKYNKNIIYISPIRHAEGNVFLSQILNYPELYEEMLTVLKEYDENIISINYDNEDNRISGKGIYKILSKSHQKALPLNVYGDGMKKAILLMSAVIKAKNGVLLLDEFETAIHTSAMNKTFKWILETCKKLNVQVFMTSHSKEAIDKVLKCTPEIIDDIAVYTMYKENGETTVRRLSARKAIEVQDEMGLELR